LCVAWDVQENGAQANYIGSARSARHGPSAILMSARHAIWIFAFVPACFHPSYDHPTCGPNGECPSGLTCSAQLVCEPDKSATNDARIDASDLPPVDARTCFGTSIVQVCLASAPTQPLVISNATTIDTTTSSMCVATVSGGTNYCVVVATSIMING